MNEQIKNEYAVSFKKAGTYRFLEGYQFEAHKHLEYEINYINSGYCIIQLESGFISLKQGDCVVIRPGTWHGFMVDVQKVCSVTQVEFLAPVPYLSAGTPCFKVTGYEELSHILESICRCNYYRKTQPIYESLMEQSLMQLHTLLSFCEKEINTSPVCPLDKVDQIIAYMEEHYTEELDVESLSLQYGISSRYLRREITKRLGMNSSNYIIMLRIAKAKGLLRDLSYSITDVAIYSGFNSSQYFSRVFSRFVGMTPTMFRYMCENKKGNRKDE